MLYKVCNNTAKVTKVIKGKAIINKTKKWFCYVIKSIKMVAVLAALA